MSTQPANPVSLALFGATGRMGREILAVLPGHHQLVLAGAGCSPGSALKGRPVAELQPGLGDMNFACSPAEVVAGADVAVDFSLPGATDDHLAACKAHRVPLVLCTTGHDAEQLERIREAAEHIPLLLAANTSLGVAVLQRLVTLAARGLGDQFDAEIFEIHHRHKRDLPSGTALKLGEAVASGRGRPLAELAQDRLPGKDQLRRQGSVGFSALRGGDVAGEHTVIFAGEGERLELVHRVARRATFAHGALRAAHWLAGREPGLYEMSDVLGLN